MASGRVVTNSCPICGTPLQPPAVLCAGCGFPTALAPEALRAFAESPAAPDVRSGGSVRSGTAMLRPPEPSRRPPDPQAEACERIAKEIRGDLAVFLQLGGDVAGVASEMGQAALVQADARPSEAAELLRGIQQRLQTGTRELFDRRLGELEFREQALLKEGVGVDFAVDIAWMRKEFEAGRRSSALSLLQIVDHKLSRIESDWRGLRGLLRQIDSLREAAAAIGEEPPRVQETLTRIREMLARSPIDSDTLDNVAQSAAEAMMMLHETVPTVIHQELDRYGLILSKRPMDEDASMHARSLLAETSRDLRRGHLVEASQHLKQLRTAMEEIQPPPAIHPVIDEAGGATAAGAESPMPAPTPAVESESDQLNRLLKKARDLASRVRNLPPDSEISYEAAGEIRRATELLRASRLDEAELTLSRLMRTLDSERLRKT